MNVHPTSSVNLDGVSFIDGITFTFDGNVPIGARFLPPGGRLVLARNVSAFNHRWSRLQ